eukprot:128974-Chlamydomonas_euryale.AAC.1
MHVHGSGGWVEKPKVVPRQGAAHRAGESQSLFGRQHNSRRHASTKCQPAAGRPPAVPTHRGKRQQARGRARQRPPLR